MIDAPPVCGTLSDGAHMGGGLTGRTHTRAESCPCVARTLTQRMHKGFDSTLDSQTPIVTHGGVFDGAVAFKPSHFTRGKDGAPSEVVAPLSADADKGDQDTVVAYDITGTLATNGASKTDVHTALRGRTPGQSESSTTTVVAFTQNSRDEVRLINDDGKIAGSIGADGGMHQTNYLAYGVTTEQTPKFSEETALTITRQSPTGRGQPQCVAFANRTRDGIKVPEVMKDGVVPALTNPGGGGRSDAVNVVVLVGVDFQNCATTGDVCGTLMGEAQKKGGEAGHGIMESVKAFSPLQGGRSMPVTDEAPTLEAGTGNKTPAIAFKPGQGADSRSVGAGEEVCCTLEGSANGNAGHKVAVQSAMQVRRLTPTECAYLQGFPADYLNIIFRKKPAADGPKYRALGNSMAVPCMWWLGYRIAKATQQDNP